MKRIWLVAGALLAACDDPVAPPRAPAPVSPSLVTSDVTITDLGTLGGAWSFAFAVNEAGQVAGISLTATGGAHAFIWEPSAGMRDLGSLGSDPLSSCGDLSQAADINDLGQAVGSSNRIGCDTRPVLWEPNTSAPIDLGDRDDLEGIARAINNLGQVVGSYTSPLTGEHAFVWTRGRGLRDINGDHMSRSRAVDINDRGEVVGVWYDLQGAGPRGFLWTERDGFTDLGALDMGQATPAAINDLGFVVGNSGWPMVWSSAGGMQRLPLNHGLLFDINDHMQVSGHDESGPFVWTEAFGADALLRLPVLPGTTFGPFGPVRLNEHGSAVGTSGDLAVAPRAVLWRIPTPVVLDPGMQLGALADQLQVIVSRGGLAGGVANGLQAKLDAAQRQLERENRDGARRLLEAFVAQVQAVSAAGQIAAPDALALVDHAAAVMAALSSS